MPRPRTNRSTIGSDPFASVIPAAPPAPRRDPPVTPSGPTAEPDRRDDTPKSVAVPIPVPTANRDTPVDTASRAPPAPVRRRKQKLTVHLDDELLDRVKNAAYWNPRLTIARIAERGIRQAIAQVEKENGGPYPQRESELVGGRPIK